MAVCTFFGHRNAPWEIKGKLSVVLSDLIENCGVNVFYRISIKEGKKSNKYSGIKKH